MKRSILLLSLFATLQAGAQQKKSLFSKAGDAVKSVTGGKSSLSNAEIVEGLKEALTVGANNSAEKLSVTDGFFGNAMIKVLMPDEAKKAESTLRKLGMGKMVDDAILSMNRAAEEASKKAAPIFVNAIKQMSFQDAVGILKGSDSAATVYLKEKTQSELTTAFKPVIDEALQKTGATKYWRDVFENYNRLPTIMKKVNPDLTGYVTEKGLNGLFYQVALEEQKIRKDPAARVTDILKKVFAK